MAAAVALAFVLVSAVPARAAMVTTHFSTNLSKNSPVYVGNFLTLVISDETFVGPDITFKISNDIPPALVPGALIDQVVFGGSADLLLTNPGIVLAGTTTPGVVFTDTSGGSVAGGGNYPGGAGNIDFIFSRDAPGDRIGFGEMLTIGFDLVGGVSFQDVIDAIGLKPDDFLIGLHVQGLPDGMGGQTSDNYLVPAPAALPAGLMLMGLLGIRRMRRKV